MTKFVIVDPQQVEAVMQEAAEAVFEDAIEIVNKHGVCYFRFTRTDGMTIIDPKHNKQINGVISDA